MNQSIFPIALLIAGLLGAILIFFVGSMLHYHRRYRRLQRERMTAEITFQENERERVAGDLHDSLGPLLSSVKLLINSIQPQTGADEAIVQQASHRIDDVLNSIRDISTNLLPPTLIRQGLHAAISAFIKTVQAGHSMDIQFYYSLSAEIQQERRIHVYRMVQEIVHNALKHSGASLLEIALAEENNQLVLMTRDNGRGFAAQESERNTRGFGLKSIESRVEILRGTLTLTAAPAKGTAYFIQLPRDKP